MVDGSRLRVFDVGWKGVKCRVEPLGFGVWGVEV